MSETYPKPATGVQLDLTKVNLQLAELTRRLSQALNTDGFERMISVLSGMQGSTASWQQSLEKTTKGVKDLADATAKTQKAIGDLSKALGQAATSVAALQKAASSIKPSKDGGGDSGGNAGGKDPKDGKPPAKEEDKPAKLEGSFWSHPWQSTKAFALPLVKGAWEKADKDSQWSPFAKNLGSTVSSGLMDTLKTTANTWLNPDKDQINSIKSQIAALNQQKAAAQKQIDGLSSQSSLKPAELAQLKAQKASLDGINASLAQQETLLDQQTNGWTRFKMGLSSVMKSAGQMIQDYILKLMLAWALQKAMSWLSASPAADGGLVTPNSINPDPGAGVMFAADGGMVPLNMGVRGKDSVPAILMPGEYVVTEDAVNHYGADFFHMANARKLAEGGLAGKGTRAGTKGGPGSDDKESGDVTLNIINVVDPRTVPKTTGQEILNVISMEAAKDGPVFKQWKAKMSGQG